MQVFLVMRRTDIPEGVLQQVDLFPNTSQRNFPYTVAGQTGYVQNIPAPSVAAGVDDGAPATTADISGLAAYLIGNVDAGGGDPLTGAQADTSAANIIARVRNLDGGGDPDPLKLELADVDAAIVAGTLTGGGSSGDLQELLSVLAGNQYVIPAGTALTGTARQGDFVEGTYRPLYDADYFLVSNHNGNLSLLKSNDFVYDGTASSALVVYGADGNLL